LLIFSKINSLEGKSLKKSGSCVPLQHLSVLPENIYNCCNKSAPNPPASSLCFLREDFDEVYPEIKEACLPVRQTISNPECENNQDCSKKNDVTMESICLHPHIDEGSFLVRMHVTNEPVVLFLGDPRVLYYTVVTSNYLPRFGLFPISFPGVVEKLLKYIISMSAALALLNMVPSYFLDGQWALFSLVDIMLPKTIYRTKKLLAETILMCGTILFGSTVFFSFYKIL